jgi:GNAT superfamily N-acetyltransferase
MNIIEKENRIFFEDNCSYGNISINNTLIKIEMIRVLPKYRGKGLASKLLKLILVYIQKHFTHAKIVLSPLPISTGAEEKKLNLEQLISFYKEYKFQESNEKSREEPYLMVLDTKMRR